MDVRFVTKAGLETRAEDDLPALLTRADGFVWVDIPLANAQAQHVLTDVFRFHPIAVRDCARRSHVPKLHAYSDHLFFILHAPELGDIGHVHLLETDVFIGGSYLVTVHGPFGAGVDPRLGLRETDTVASRIESGRLQPESPSEVAYAIASAVATRIEDFVQGLATKVAELERRIVGRHHKDPEEALEELFSVRHELLTVRTMAAQSREIYARLATYSHVLTDVGRPFVEDLVDRFDRVTSICDGEKEFLQGVVDFHQSRTATKMNVAMERLALIGALALPVTAIASVYGMNIIVNERSDFPHILIVSGVMLVMIALLLRWAKRHEWW